MKKNITCIVLATAMLCGASAQNRDLQKWTNKVPAFSDPYEVPTSRPSSQTDYHKLMDRAYNLQYAAVVAAGVGAGFTLAGALMGTKDYTDLPKGSDPIEELKSDQGTRKTLFIVGGSFFGAALVLELLSIDLKMKAGKTLSLRADSSGGKITYSF